MQNVEIRDSWSQWEDFSERLPVEKRRSIAPYGSWVAALKRRGILPVEYLTPTLFVKHNAELPLAMQDAAKRFDAERVARINDTHWGYYFYLGKGHSTLGAESNLQQNSARYRSLHRLRMIQKALAAIFQDDLSKISCIDLACNWGAFSLEVAALGCGTVFGVDVRPENIRKAEMLRNYVGYENVKYEVGDVFNAAGQYDLVLNLGLMYHVTRPFELIQKTYDLCTQVAIIETIVHREPFSGFVLGNGENISHEHSAGVSRIELHPTYRALLDLMRAVGFKNLMEIEAEPDPAWKNFSSDPFGQKLRRAIIGFK